jgi:hypothetical protein
MLLEYLIHRVMLNSRITKGAAMISRQSVQEPLAFRLVREFLMSKTDESEDLRPIDDKEFYSAMALLTAGVIVLALTIGPFALV